MGRGVVKHSCSLFAGIKNFRSVAFLVLVFFWVGTAERLFAEKSDCLQKTSIYKYISENGHFSPEQMHAIKILDQECSFKDEQSFVDKGFNLLPRETLSDFEILRGRKTKEYSLLSQIDRTETLFGHVELAKKIILPCDDIKGLKEQQDVLRELVENKELFNRLDLMVKSFRDVESVFISFMRDKEDAGKEDDYDELKTCNIRDLISQYLFFLPKAAKKYINDSKMLRRLDEATFITECFPYFKVFESTMLFWFAMAVSHRIIKGVIKLGNRETPESWVRIKRALGAATRGEEGGFQEYFSTLFDLLGEEMKGIASLEAATFAGYKMRKLYASILKFHSDFIKVGTFFAGPLRGLQSLLKKNYIFQKHIPELYLLSEIDTTSREFRVSKNFSRGFKKIFSLLDTKTFSGNSSPLFSRKGRMIALLTLLETEKDFFIPIFKIIGKLDALLSLAKLYKEFESKKVSYNFSSFLDSKRPTFMIEDFWNPFIDPEKVVKNSLATGDDGKGRCFIFTAPNAAGKSSAMKAIGISIIMAQTCGISPGYLKFTPFSYIDSHLEVIDDIASEKSRYMMDVTRLHEMISKIKSLPKGKFSYVIIDELLSSTDSKSGAAISRALGKYIASDLTNCICIIASHLVDIAKVESDTDGIFKSYQFIIKKDLYEDEHGNERTDIIFTHKLETGVVSESIAVEIMQNIGFDEAIVQESFDFLKASRKFGNFSGNESLPQFVELQG